MFVHLYCSTDLVNFAFKSDSNLLYGNPVTEFTSFSNKIAFSCLVVELCLHRFKRLLLVLFSGYYDGFDLKFALFSSRGALLAIFGSTSVIRLSSLLLI